jgi:hypothetical protein
MNAARQIVLKKTIQLDVKSFKLMIFNVEKKKRKTAKNLSNCIQASSKVMRKVERFSIISTRKIEQQLISMQSLQKQNSETCNIQSNEEKVL